MKFKQILVATWPHSPEESSAGKQGKLVFYGSSFSLRIDMDLFQLHWTNPGRHPGNQPIHPSATRCWSDHTEGPVGGGRSGHIRSLVR